MTTPEGIANVLRKYHKRFRAAESGAERGAIEANLGQYVALELPTIIVTIDAATHCRDAVLEDAAAIADKYAAEVGTHGEHSINGSMHREMAGDAIARLIRAAKQQQPEWRAPSTTADGPVQHANTAANAAPITRADLDALLVEIRRPMTRAAEYAYGDVLDALEVAVAAWRHQTTQFALSEIGLGGDITFPMMPARMQTMAQAEALLLRLRPGCIPHRPDLAAMHERSSSGSREWGGAPPCSR